MCGEENGHSEQFKLPDDLADRNTAGRFLDGQTLWDDADTRETLDFAPEFFPTERCP